LSSAVEEKPGDARWSKAAGARARCILDLTADYYWEQDEHDRFTLLLHRDASLPENAPERFLGRTPWELEGEPLGTTWQEHRALRRARRPFGDVVVRISAPGRPRYLAVSGQPMFHAGTFKGYQGVCRDVTARVRDEHLLGLEREINRILVAEESAEKAMVATMRAVCEAEGWAAGQYWRLDEAEGVLRIHAGWSAEEDRLRPVLCAALALECGPGVGLVGEVLRSGALLWVPDLDRDSRVLRRDLPEQTGWRSALLAPVLLDGRTVGVLDFNAARIPEPDAGLSALLHALGTQLGRFYGRAVALARLREREERYAGMVELAAIGIGHVSPDGRILYANRQLREMLGYTHEELQALTVSEISHPDDVYVTARDSARLHAGEIESFKAEKRYLRRDGTPLWVRLTIAAERGADGRVLHDVSIVEDVSERRRAEERIQYLATHDELTGLANRTLFSQLLGHAIEQRRRYGRCFAVMFVDLDRFKVINDSLGHEGGDILLHEVADRLRACLRASDVVARFGGDEFVLLVEELSGREGAALVARHVLSAVLQPVTVLGQECRVTASIGVSLCPDDAEDPASLLKNADLAMYLAKGDGKNAFQFYSPEISVLASQRLKIEASLRGALERGELTMHYQAKVDSTTGAISGVEALMRWTHPELGSVPPATFIPIAEECDLIVPIGQWALTTACAQSAEWVAAGLPPVRMAVNLSPRQFTDPDLVGNIERALEETGMRPDLMELEITEGMMMQDVDQALEKLLAIRRLGVRLAIDDFGTGYSSLSQLKRLPIDTLKVDRSFVRDLPTDAGDVGITEAIIAMGRTLGVSVVAEGVETVEQQAFLSERHCHEMQGFLFSRPVPPEDFAELLRAPVPFWQAS
jgi:diguanylate cyclase (GGDEF)-like protein/PAS domain S-box-containing protein